MKEFDVRDYVNMESDIFSGRSHNDICRLLTLDELVALRGKYNLEIMLEKQEELFEKYLGKKV
jgi:hypothetical protein